VSVDADDTGSGQLAARVAATLAAAEIPPSKLGPARRARLSQSERELYFWILRRFATAGRPSSVKLRAAAEQLGLEADPALATLAREDLVHRSTRDRGRLPLLGQANRASSSLPGRARGRRDVRDRRARDRTDVRRGDRDRVARPGERRRDPCAGRTRRVRRVVAQLGGRRRRRDPQPRRRMLWLLSGAELLRFRRQRGALAGRAPEVRGTSISIREAAAAGRAVFGDVLTGA
jgi:hypothetical protein